VLLPVALAQKAGITGLETVREGDSGASIVQGLRGEQREARREYIATLSFDQVSLDLSGMPVVKIDVEGAELDVLSGMQAFLRSSRPFVLCEVLHAHGPEQLDLMARHNEALMHLLSGLDYDVLRLRKDARWANVVGVEAVRAFPHEVYRWDSQSVCDYLFAPRERVLHVAEAFFAAGPVGPAAARA
jgi:hypothetical protein